MKTRTERARELRLMVETGGYQVGRVVALFLDAARQRMRSGIGTEHMIEVILDDEESRGQLVNDRQSDIGARQAAASRISATTQRRV